MHARTSRVKNYLKIYLRYRNRIIRERPLLIKKFLNELARILGSNATIIVFGGRGSRETLYASGPRDLDLLIITILDPIKAEELVWSSKPRSLPANIIVIHTNDFKCNNIIKSMLKRSIIFHDGLYLRSLLTECINK